MWSVEREPGHTYRDPDEIIPHAKIEAALAGTKEAAKDPARVAAILASARSRAMLSSEGEAPEPGKYE